MFFPLAAATADVPLIPAVSDTLLPPTPAPMSPPETPSPSVATIAVAIATHGLLSPGYLNTTGVLLLLLVVVIVFSLPPTIIKYDHLD